MPRQPIEDKDRCTDCGRNRATYCAVYSARGGGGSFHSHEHLCRVCQRKNRSALIRVAWCKPVAECPGAAGVKQYYTPLYGQAERIREHIAHMPPESFYGIGRHR